MQSQFSKVIIFNNKPFNLCAKFKLLTGWIGIIEDKYIVIPKDKCHVSPSFDDDEEADKSCWTKNSVFNFLEKKIKNRDIETQYIQQGVSKNQLNYFVIAKFCVDTQGWRGYIKTNYGEKYIQIPHDKCHVSPHLENYDNNENWTKISVLKYLHQIANNI